MPLADGNPSKRLETALVEEWCNGCGQPREKWGPICGGMSQGDWTHYHSAEWWRQRFAQLMETRDYRWRTDAKLTRDPVAAAHRLHIEGGISIRELGRRLWETFGYASAHSCANSLSDLFARQYRPARDRVEATRLASTTHGRAARADRAAYKRWHRATFGPWPSDSRKGKG
jgi:hypothetical protein